MSKFYFEAIRKLPENFVDDETRIIVPDSVRRNWLIATNPKHPPIKYFVETKKWSDLKADEEFKCEI